jgi:uncharacterized protein YceH (UPF0502 family)
MNADPGPPKRVPRLMTAAECRVLGSLLEKQQAVPDSYPMTVPALVAACNQKTNREPVMELTETEVAEALRALSRDVLVGRREGGRAVRWEQNTERRWRVSPGGKAVLTLLLLRGAQTPGELRGRAERLHDFPSVAAVEAVLDDLAGGDEPLVRQLPREPGQKESRWIHLLGEGAGAAHAASAAPVHLGAFAPGSELEQRLTELEARIARLETQLVERS